jgi:prevent-host-death family protein
MPQQWSLQDAKNKFSEVVNAARQGEPQLVTRRGEPAVVVLSAEAYAAMLRRERLNAPSFAQFLLSMPAASSPVLEKDMEKDEAQGPPLTLREVDW